MTRSRNSDVFDFQMQNTVYWKIRHYLNAEMYIFYKFMCKKTVEEKRWAEGNNRNVCSFDRKNGNFYGF